MIERAIENWLINTNERNYHVPFCQVLISEGYEILYISPHGQLEFGKDIIAIAPNGETCAYQLKGGNITLSVFRSIMGEIYQLIDTKCDHPNVDKIKPHKSYLVANGDIKDDAFQTIDKINNTETHYSKLETINKDQLLKMFLAQNGKFLPQSFEGFGYLMKFFTKDGKDFFPKDEFYQFIKNNILVKSGQKSEKLNSIFSSVILTSYLLQNYQQENNNYAEFEAWTVLFGTLVSYIDEQSLDEKKIVATLNLIFDNIKESVKKIYDEFLDKDDLLEGDLLGDGGAVYRARITLLLGVVALHCLINNTFEEKVLAKVKSVLKHGWYWGETAFPSWVLILKYLEKQKENPIAYSFIESFLKATLVNNGLRNKTTAYPNVYYDSQKVLNAIFDIEPIDYSQFKGRSFVLEPLVSLAIRRELKELLQSNWKQITHIQYEKFIPDKDSDLFNLHNKSGTNYTEFPNQTEKYSSLKAKYENKVNKKLWNEYTNYMSCFILCYPNRIHEELIRFIDSSY
jgi:hypothetical protein